MEDRGEGWKGREVNWLAFEERHRGSLIRGDSAQLKQEKKFIRKRDRGGFNAVVGQVREPGEKSRRLSVNRSLNFFFW